MDPYLHELAQRVGETVAQRGWMLTTAESCTGGWVAEVVTAVAGSSGWFDRGFVTYSNPAKQDMLGVRAETLTAHGAVSEAAVREMAEGALVHSRAQLSVAISGIAGPGGGTPDKPVGTVWLAWASPAGVISRVEHFVGDREVVRRRAVITAIRGLLDVARG